MKSNSFEVLGGSSGLLRRYFSFRKDGIETLGELVTADLISVPGLGSPNNMLSFRAEQTTQSDKLGQFAILRVSNLSILFPKKVKSIDKKIRIFYILKKAQPSH